MQQYLFEILKVNQSVKKERKNEKEKRIFLS
jgi:hypothetical protein